MTILVTTIALSLGLVTPVYAGTEIVTREVSGYGETEKLAVIDALIEGISQVLGISMAAKDELRSEFTEVIKEEGGQSESSLLATTEVKQEISTQSKGYVKSYEILSVVFLADDGHFKAVLSVQIPKYVAADQGRSKMRTIAVLPFRDLSTGQLSTSTATTTGLESDESEIKLEKTGGVYEVPVELNDVLKIQMIIDSGASDVFITPDIALALWRSGTLTEDDALSGAYYQLADGSVEENARFRLKSVTIGNRTVTNVICSVSNSIQAPMLLGQSALSKLGQYTFDHERAVLVVGKSASTSKQKESSSLSLSRQLNQNLISELTQARKFRVLDREYLAELTGEQNVLKSDDVAMEETLRLGQNLGADYLVVGAITDYRIDQKSKEVLGLTTVQHEAALVFDYRVIALATREVMWSGTYNEFFNHRRLRKLVPKNSGDRQVSDAMIAHAAHGVASELLDVIFPIKVLSMNADNEVYLNQGGIRVKEGEIFEIFSPGQKVVDPDTGLAMRLDGARVATIEIISVRAKFSVGRLVDGDPDQIYQHAISRRAAAAVVEAIKTDSKPKKKKVEW